MKNEKGFTLIELIMVICILFIVTILILPRAIKFFGGDYCKIKENIEIIKENETIKNSPKIKLQIVKPEEQKNENKYESNERY